MFLSNASFAVPNLPLSKISLSLLAAACAGAGPPLLLLPEGGRSGMAMGAVAPPGGLDPPGSGVMRVSGGGRLETRPS